MACIHPRNMSDRELLNVPTDDDLAKVLQQRLWQMVITKESLNSHTYSKWDALVNEELTENIEALLDTDDEEETIKLAATIKELNDERMDTLEDYLNKVQDLIA